MKKIMENDFVLLVTLILLTISAVREFLKFWKFAREKQNQFKINEKFRSRTKDTLIVTINIFLGYVVPAYFIWSNCDHSWLSWWIIPKLIAFYIIISNILLWWIIAKAFRLIKDIEKEEPACK